MIRKTSKKLVTFHHPFTLDGLTEAWPPGDYTIETDYESTGRGPFDARQVFSTILVVRTKDGKRSKSRYIDINPDDLVSALSRDRAAGSDAPETAGS